MSELDLATDIDNYLWVVVVGFVFGFLASMGIGSNDIANAFSTSVGSGALSVRNAVIIAIFCEAGGAILMGSHVTDTIRKGIANYECFEDNPPALMFGAMSVLLAVGIWLFLASYFEMPVSTTHSTVGGMIGMTLAIGGADCVNWYEPLDNFPYVGGVSGIILSWVISPVFSAILAIAFFAITRAAVLRFPNSFNRAAIAFPFFVGITVTLNIFLIIYKGAKGIGLHNTELWVALVSAFSCGVGTALIMIPFLKCIKQRVLDNIEKEENRLKEIEMQELESQHKKTDVTTYVEGKDDDLTQSMESLGTSSIVSEDLDKQPPNCCKGPSKIDCSKESCMKNKYCKALTKSINYEVHTDLKKDGRVKEIHDNSEKFDSKTEEFFKSLQIFTAIFDSFSHGANDISNAIGPLAAIYVIYRSGGIISEDSELGSDAYWILAFGSVGMIVGLAVYGYKIIRTIGVKLCMITPSRGVSIELASATVIIIGSRLGIPLSTTHCQVGATMGVAALEDPKTCKGMNCAVVGKTFLGWILTLLAVGGTSALLVAYSVYAPCVRTMYANDTFVNGSNFTTMMSTATTL